MALFGLIVVVLFILTGCVKRPIIVSCVEGKTVQIEGPIIVNNKDLIFYDATGKLNKVSSGTCGIKAVKE